MLYSYGAADLHGRVLAGKIKVAAAVAGGCSAGHSGEQSVRRPAAGFLRSPCAAVPASCQLTIFQLSVAKTAGFVIVDEACRLHKGVADGVADKTEAAFFQFAAQRV